jgi:DNA replicative helicase MCM subunit Mcm2 (Cdc46/Mcm family)
VERENIIEKFVEFLREEYYNELVTAINEGRKSIYIDFSLLDKFDPELADYLLENPEEVLELAEESIRQIDLPGEPKLKVRIFNLPENREVRIRNIRAEHIGKLIAVDGIVKRASEIRPEVSEVVFSCPACGREITVIQTERVIQGPIECECGNRKGFKLLKGRQKLYDARWIVIEEPFEIVSGERPSEIMVFLKEDLTSPKMQNKTDPGNRIKVIGILKELPKRVKGTRSRQVEIYIEANCIESLEVEWEELEITPEDEKKILELAKDPEIYEKFVRSIGPSLYGLEEVKEAIVLQLFGGEPHIQKDKSRVRGDIHILLVGDPSCLVGDERVILANGSIVKISSLGSYHLQEINVPVYLAEGYKRGVAKVFHKYEFHPIIEIVTESGKSIKGTFNQPVLAKESGKDTFGKPLPAVWKRLDEIKIGDSVRTIDWIPCRIYKYVETKWNIEDDSKRGKKIKIPKVVDEKLASILGYLLANGYVQKYRVGCTFSQEELELIPKMKEFFKEIFGIEPRLKKHKGKNGIEMVFNSFRLAKVLQFIKIKRIPELILQSKNSVVACFLSWLYDGNGSVISKGKSIVYKAKDVELLRDIQILLLRFGIHSRINGNNLTIEEANSIVKFAQHIGFNSKKKKEKLEKLVEEVKKLKKRNHYKRWEEVVKIIYHPPQTVYDIEVPNYHKFVANGIVCHNTAKSALMKIVSSLIPRGRYVSGKGVTAAGLTATVVRDEEFLGGWVLEAGALVLCNGSLCAIDEFEKVEKSDQIALHEAMEQQTISIAKANIVATLPARTSILAGGNPKLGRFDPYLPIKEQIDVPETLLARFDLKFALRDIPNPELDAKIADHILKARHFEGEEIKPEIEPELIRKYVAYARKNCHPKLTKEAGETIKEFFVKLREKSGEESPVPITLRQYEALIRLAEASAKVQLRNEVTKEDAIRAINLMKASLRQFGFDPEIGKIDIDRVEGHITAAQRSKIRILLEVIDELTNTIGKNIPKEDIIKLAKSKGLKEFDIEKMLNELKNNGTLFEPRPGILQKM